MLVKEVLEVLKASLRLQGQYAVVKNSRILSDNEYISDQDEIVLVPIVEGG
ncbi:MAG: MoaD/ThiS family protein [Thermoprotei archaeon]